MSDKEYKGCWLDNETGKLVDSPPERGVQVYPAGAEPTADALAYRKRLEDEADGKSEPEVISTPEPRAAEPVVKPADDARLDDDGAPAPRAKR